MNQSWGRNVPWNKVFMVFWWFNLVEMTQGMMVGE